MGYWIDTSDNYWEGDRLHPTDIEVTQRPYPTCDWNAGTSSWDYNLPNTRIYVKNVYNTAMEDDLNSALRESTDPSNVWISLGYIAMLADIVAYRENAANNVPFFDGYLAISGLADLAAVYAALSAAPDLAATILGKILAQRDLDYALIDAAVTGPDITAIVYVRPF